MADFSVVRHACRDFYLAWGRNAWDKVDLFRVKQEHAKKEDEGEIPFSGLLAAPKGQGKGFSPTRVVEGEFFNSLLGPIAKPIFPILNDVKDLNLLKMRDYSLRSE